MYFYLEQNTKRGWINGIDCGRCMAAGIKEDVSTSKESFPTEVPVDPEIPEEKDATMVGGEDDAQKQLIKRPHVNLGRPSSHDFIRVLKCAHAQPSVLRHVKRKLEREVCEAHRAPAWRRRVGVPHTYQINRLIALDTLFIKIGENTVPVFNVVDHGTNFQVAAVLAEHTSTEVASAC